MSDLIDDGPAGSNAPEYSVSELSGAVKKTIEGAFGLVRVRGEVGRVSRPRSGHVYLDLKDERSVLAGVIWKGAAARLATQPEEGMEVTATGRLTTFAGQSRYQIVIEDIAPAGIGALMAMLEKRRAALAAEGLFDATRKSALPYLPDVIGVVTSPSGAVIRDILHRLRDRFPRHVLVWPVAVQGERSAPEIAAAIRGFNALPPGGPVPRPDVLIVARGGGSIEDLWGFNDEAVVRAAAESEIPLISAVGHETDTTLIDFAADRRAPTPTAAAEMAVPVRADLATALAGVEERRRRAVAQHLTARGQRVRDLARALPRPETMLGERVQRLDSAAARLPKALAGYTRERRSQLERLTPRPALLASGLRLRAGNLRAAAAGLAGGLRRQVERARSRLGGARLRPRSVSGPAVDARARLNRAHERLARAASAAVAGRRDALVAAERLLASLGYTETLARGFTVVRDDTGGVLTRAEAARGARALEIEFADGRVSAAPVGRSRPRKKPKDPPQGSLF